MAQQCSCVDWFLCLVLVLVSINVSDGSSHARSEDGENVSRDLSDVFLDSDKEDTSEEEGEIKNWITEFAQEYCEPDSDGSPLQENLANLLANMLKHVVYRERV